MLIPTTSTLCLQILKQKDDVQKFINALALTFSENKYW